MKIAVSPFLLALAAAPVSAQVSPTPGMDDPRLQSVVYDPSRSVRLVAFPGATLTVMLLRGETIERAVLSEQGTFDVRVTGTGDSLNILALRPDAHATLLVDTRDRHYQFELDTGEGLAAAYIVRFAEPGSSPGPLTPLQPADASDPAQWSGHYRLSGEASLRPHRIGDDGLRTYLEWPASQSLPAVFGIGPSGEEEVVDGYMRGDMFVIDRVYTELVFRIDKLRARARRTESSQ